MDLAEEFASGGIDCEELVGAGRSGDEGFVVYSPTDIAMLVYYLEDSGVTVDTLGIAAIPQLMFNYMNKDKLPQCKKGLEHTINWLLKGDKADDEQDDFDAPSGW